MEQIRDWLMPAAPFATIPPEDVVVSVPETVTLQLEPINHYEIAFERLLEMMVDHGVSMKMFCDEYHAVLDAKTFRTWIARDKTRMDRFRRAKEVMGEMVIEEKMLTVADDPLTMEDIQRTRLRFDAMKWWLTVQNPKRYSPKQENINTNYSVDIKDLLEEREKRLREMKEINPRGMRSSHLVIDNAEREERADS